MADEDISQIAKSCQRNLINLLDAVKSVDAIGKFGISERDVQQILERYDQWAGNLGAFQPSKSSVSLEHRLQNSPAIRDAIANMLRDLDDSAKADIAREKRDNRSAPALLGSETDSDLEEYGISSSDSDSSISPQSSLSAKPLVRAPTFEIQELLSAIKISLENLFKTSVFIRKFAPDDKRQRAAKTSPFDNRADIMYILDRYPFLATKHEALASRLGEANARRRQYFKYRRSHNDKLSRSDAENSATVSRFAPELRPGGADAASKAAKTGLSSYTKPSLLADTEATEFLLNSNVENDFSALLLDPVPALSTVSFATSVVESSDNSLIFPPLPLGAENSSYFLCPYCLTVVSLNAGNKDRQWRKHVRGDLEPYICTFPGCGLDTYESQHAWFEHELIAHRTNWHCSRCNEVLGAPEILERHIIQRHGHDVSQNQIASVVEQSRRPITSIPPSECPFCDDDWYAAEEGLTADQSLEVTLDQFRRHLGHHLQQVALFSLPRFTEDQNTESNQAGGLLDRDSVASSYRWIRDDCGRGWSIVSRRRTTFIAFAYFRNCLERIRKDSPAQSIYPWSSRKLTYTSPAHKPFPRYGAAANSVSSKEGDLYISGGLVDSTLVKGDLWIIEAGNNMSCFQVDTFEEGPGPRVGHAAALVGNAFIVHGGDTKFDEDDGLDETMYLLNTSTRQWSRLLPDGERPTGRYGHTLNLLGSKVYVFGGQTESYFMNDLSTFDLNEIQKPSTTWEILTRSSEDQSDEIPGARTNHTVVAYDDKLYLFGGTNGVVWYNDVWSYDPITNRWSQLDCIGYLPLPREGHSAAIVNDSMYIFGGRSAEGRELGDVSAFRIPQCKWYKFENMGPAPSPRSGHSMTAVENQIIVMGGEPSITPRSVEELELIYCLDTNKIKYPD